jgi:hypothetical protein
MRAEDCQIGERSTTSRFREWITVRVAHGRGTSPSVSVDAQQSLIAIHLGRRVSLSVRRTITALKKASYMPDGWSAFEVKNLGPTDESPDLGLRASEMTKMASFS